MTIRNRELSQFGSFIYVDNSSQEIGIATEALPYIGIGTANPEKKLHVVGDVKIDGDLDYNGQLSFGNVDLNTTGIITASAFYNPLGQQLIAFDSWTESGSDIYRESGNVGIGTSVITEKLTVLGNVSASRFISTVSTGTQPFQVSSTTEVTNLNASLLRGGIPGSNINSYDIVTNAGAQTLTNKTLTLPTFGGTGVAFTGSTSGVTTVRASATASGIIVLPAVSGISTVLTTGSVGVITSGMIEDLSITNSDVSTTAGITYGKLNLSGSIVNADIATGAAIAVSKLASSTISGISLGNNLNNLTAGSFITYNSGTTYNGSASRTISVNATSANTGDTVVARNSSGDFSAGTISVTNLTATQTVQATNFSITNLSATNGNFTGIVTALDFNSTSDFNLKTNIQTVQNSLETVEQLRGVSFDWKNTGKSSIGVIAQELEQVLPELVTDGDPKTVNYNGLIGVLIEAVKELKKEIEELKSTK